MQAYAAQQVLSNPEAFARSFGQLGSAVSQITTPFAQAWGARGGQGMPIRPVPGYGYGYAPAYNYAYTYPSGTYAYAPQQQQQPVAPSAYYPTGYSGYGGARGRKSPRRRSLQNRRAARNSRRKRVRKSPLIRK